MKRRESIPGLGKITMKNQNLLVRQTITVLMACGLIVSLLPGVAAAQDWSTQEARAAWLIEQYRGQNIEPNGKNHPAIALARLKLNPNDAAAISSIANFFDKLPEGENGNQFNYSGVAWVLGKYWDKFTPAQRDHLKARLKGFSDLLGHGTENHAIMKCVAAYLFAQYWPNETGWVRGTKTSAEVMETARGRLLSIVKGLYNCGYAENLSNNYVPVHIWPFLTLYECVADPEMKSAADAALHFHLANVAANQFEGVGITPANRDYSSATLNAHSLAMPGGPSLHWIRWFYWPDAQNFTPIEKDDGDGMKMGYFAISSWKPPAAINSLARGQTAPYVLTSSARGWIAYWGVTDSSTLMGRPAECVRYVYRDKLYAMGSGFFQYQPGSFYVDYNAFRAIYKSPDRFNHIECYHPYWHSDDPIWEGLNSPFMQMAQHKGTAIAIFNIPTEDPWAGCGTSGWQASRDEHFDNLIHEALVSYPTSIDQKTEENGWIFLREGDVYIAIRPLKDYTIDNDYKPGKKAVATAEDFNVIRSAFAQTGFVFDIATKEEFATFGAFQSAVAQNPPAVDWAKLSVTYKSVRGDVLTATWNPPKYDAKGQRILVRPDITVNGAVVPIDSDFINGVASMKSQSVTIANGVLRLQTPAGQLEVDWRGEVPKFSYRVPAHNTATMD
ncbi:MAG: hypothetical protein ACQESR_19025 [Planctomycetota bacterium]